MDNFDLWTKQNINDIIFNFNEKNYELLRSFIKWYEIESNYMYILSTRYFYSNECLEVLLSTINAFIDVKNNDISEDDVVNELDKEIDITEEVVVNELEKKNDSDEYVINDDYYFKENRVKNEDVVEDSEDREEVDEEVLREDEDNNNLIINKFSNNEIILLLNILEEDTKKFSKHNYIIGKCKEELFFYNNFYIGFTTGILFYCLLKLL